MEQIAVIIAITIPTLILISQILYFDIYKNKKQQQKLLEILLDEILSIKEDINGLSGLEEIKTAFKFPVYKLNEIDSAFYLRNLEPSIKSIDTFYVKKYVVKIHDKTKLLNYFFNKLNNAAYSPAYRTVVDFSTNKTFGETMFDIFYPKVIETKNELDDYLFSLIRTLDKTFGIIHKEDTGIYIIEKPSSATSDAK